MDAKQERIATIAKWGIGLVGAVVISPFVFLAVKGIVGLIIAVVLVTAAVQFAPAVGVWISNMALKSFIGAVEANPVESLKNLKIEKAEEADQTRKDIEAFDTELRNFKGQLKQVKRDFPEEAADYDAMVSAEEEGLSQMQEDYNEALAGLNQLDKEISKGEALWKLALSALRVTKLNKSQKEAVYQDIKKKTAFDAITSKVNQSFASLDASVRERKNRQPLKLISVGPVPTSEVKTAKRAEIVR